MRQRPLGDTGIQVSELSLGTWGISGDGYGPVTAGEAKRVIDRARAMGINLFETASCYSLGSIETDLGSALGPQTPAAPQTGLSDQGAASLKTALKGSDATVVIRWGTDLQATPARKRFDRAFLTACAEQSRKRLGDVRIIALLHNPTAKTLKENEAKETMAKLVEQGTISHWGVSIGSAEVGEAALDAGASVISLSYNILTVQPFRALQNRIKELNPGVLAHSVLFYGLLAGRWAPGKEFRYQDHRADRWPEGALRERIRHLDAVRPLVSGDVTTMRSAAVRFVLENPLVSSAVLGPRNGTQLDQLVRECQAEPPYLSEGKMSALEGRLKNFELER